jgi:hypothetical protein
MSEAPLFYSPLEVSTCLPSGWLQVDGGEWLPGKQVWRTQVRDGADQDWQLEVEPRAADKLGRSEALRSAVGRLYREALG